jgi:hypothetical protein
MAKRGAQPALYEMMRSRPTATPNDAAPVVRAPASVPAPEPVAFDSEDLAPVQPSPTAAAIVDLLRPGRTLRLPVGYVFLGVAALIALVLVAYVIGNRQGHNARDAELAENFGSPMITPRVNDPLTLEAQEPSPDGGGSALPGSGSRGGGSGTPRTAANSASWGPVEPKGDPRQKGVNYFILAETTPQGALRLAEFCRANGLESYVVAGKNARRRVIAFPGYQGSRLDPAVKALEDRIHAIGDKYKTESKGETNMRDAYPSRYDG